MTDGAQDFETFAHGCALMTSAIQEGKLRTALNVTTDWPEERLADALLQLFPDRLPESDLLFIGSGISLLENIQEASAASTCYPFWQAQMKMSQQFYHSPRLAVISSFNSFSNWFSLSPGLLSALRKPSDSLGIILIALFLANMTLCKVLMPLRMWPETAKSPLGLPIRSLQQTEQWIEAIYRTVPESEQGQLTRPRIMMRMFPYTSLFVRDEGAENRKLEILQDLENKAHMVVGDILRLGSDLTTWFEKTLTAEYRAQKMTSAPG